MFHNLNSVEVFLAFVILYYLYGQRAGAGFVCNCSCNYTQFGVDTPLVPTSPTSGTGSTTTPTTVTTSGTTTTTTTSPTTTRAPMNVGDTCIYDTQCPSGQVQEGICCYNLTGYRHCEFGNCAWAQPVPYDTICQTDDFCTRVYGSGFCCLSPNGTSYCRYDACDANITTSTVTTKTTTTKVVECTDQICVADYGPGYLCCTLANGTKTCVADLLACPFECSLAETQIACANLGYQCCPISNGVLYCLKTCGEYGITTTTTTIATTTTAAPLSMYDSCRFSSDCFSSAGPSSNCCYYPTGYRQCSLSPCTSSYIGKTSCTNSTICKNSFGPLSDCCTDGLNKYCTPYGCNITSTTASTTTTRKPLINIGIGIGK